MSTFALLRDGLRTAAIATITLILAAPALAGEIFVAYAAPGSKTERFCVEQLEQGKRLYTFNMEENAGLLQRGVMGVSDSRFAENIARSGEEEAVSSCDRMPS